MGSFYTTIVPPSDKLVFSLFAKLEEITKQRSNFNYAGLQRQIFSSDPVIVNSKAVESYRITNANINADGIGVGFQRNVAASSGSSSHTQHPYFCTISVISNDNQQSMPELFILINDEISAFIKKNKLLPMANALGGDDPVGPQSAMLSAIQTAASEQIIRTQEFFHELTKRFEDRHAALEEEYTSQKKFLAEEASRNDEKVQVALEALKSEEAALEQRRKELDDRDNTHARRAIKTEILETLRARQESFSISRDTRLLRWPIHAVFLLLLLGTSGGAVWSLYVWGTGSGASWTDALAISGIIKSVVLTFAFLTSAGLYISWMNRWFDKHADAQFVTKQYEIDINRATWAVEAALEWQRAQGGEMPPALVNGITNHLFERERGETQDYSPLEALASSILGSAANMKLNMGGTEVTLDRKSIKTIGK